ASVAETSFMDPSSPLRRGPARAIRTVRTGVTDLPPRDPRRHPWAMIVVAAAPSISIRPIRNTDLEALARFYGELSAESSAARFPAAGRGIGERIACSFCGPDHEHREGLVAEASDATGTRSIVGHLCLEPIGDGEAEVAVAVADA